MATRDERFGLNSVRGWMLWQGDSPQIWHFRTAISGLCKEWERHKKLGMDTVAAAIIDEIETIAKAMRGFEP